MADKENDMFKAMDAKGNGDLQNWAERYYAKMVEEIDGNGGRTGGYAG